MMSDSGLKGSCSRAAVGSLVAVAFLAGLWAVKAAADQPPVLLNEGDIFQKEAKATGDSCAAPIVVNLPGDLPYTDAHEYTCGRGNDYSTTCLGSYDGGEDIIYRLNVATPACLSITVTGNTTANNWIGIGVGADCPLGGVCMYTAKGNSGTTVTVQNVALNPGTYYVMVDTWPPPSCLTDFTLTITGSTGCVSGACCLPGGCQVMFEDSCSFAGGAFLGDGSICQGEDCNHNGIGDVCDVASGTSADCNGNGIPDECDLASGASHDWDENAVPDECQPDCNENGYPDFCDLPGCCYLGSYLPDHGCMNDPSCGLSQDCQPNGIPDECELGGGDPYLYQVDDGVSEDEIGVAGGADVGAIVSYTVVSGANRINAVSIAFGGSTNGDPVTAYVWSDPNQDGNPADAHVLASGTATTQNSGTDAFITVPVSPQVNAGPPGTKFFVGFIATSDDVVIAIDTTTPVPGRNWIVASAYSTPPVDPNDLGSAAYNNPLGTLESYDYPGNLMIRAEGQFPSWDCNHNGMPDECEIMCGLAEDCNENGLLDECDIEDGTSQDCNINLVPDECELLAGTSLDCNENGLPDECDIAIAFGGFCDPALSTCSTDYTHNGIPDECDDSGDFTGPGTPDPFYPPPDGIIDAADYWYLHDGIGFCAGNSKYDLRPLADMDGNGCITLVDYQNWLMCYRMANGKDFVPPPKKLKAIPVGPPSEVSATDDRNGGLPERLGR